MVKIDLKDRRILAELDMQGRMPMTQLAKRVGLSRQVVEYRLKKLRKEKVIFGTIGVFDSAVVGEYWYRVVFRLLQVTQKEKEKFLDFLAHHPKVLWLGEIGGNWDVIVNFVSKDNFEFNALFESIVQEYGKYIMEYELLIYVDVHDQSREYILDEGICGEKRMQFYHAMRGHDSYSLDELDKQIIRELSTNAWVSNLELGEKLGVSANTIKNRIAVMKERKLLLGFRTFINPGVFGYQSHMLFLEIKKMDLKRERQLYAYLKTIPNVVFLVKHIGKWRIGMEIETRTIEDFQKIFVGIRGEFHDIISDYQSSPIFRDLVANYFPAGALE